MPDNFHPKDEADPFADYTVDRMYAFLSSYQLPRDIGSKYEYSNLGVGLLGHALALRAGKSYEDLVTERILRPLGMNDTRITLSPSMKSRLTPGHSPTGSVVANWDLPTLAGAGALRSTANDLLKFLAANLDSNSAPLGRVLAITHVDRRDVDGVRMRIGLNWHILNTSERRLIWHNGGTGGYRTFIGFDTTGKARSGGAVESIDLGGTTSASTFSMRVLRSLPGFNQGPHGDLGRSCSSGILCGRVPARAELCHHHHAPGELSVRPGHRTAALSIIRGGADRILSQGCRRPGHVRERRFRQSDPHDSASERDERAGSEAAAEISGWRRPLSSGFVERKNVVALSARDRPCRVSSLAFLAPRFPRSSAFARAVGRCLQRKRVPR